LREALEDVQAARGQVKDLEVELARLRDQEVFLQQKVSEAKSLFDELSSAHQ
jgi:predicted nuclease with TOPRIM domain